MPWKLSSTPTNGLRRLRSTSAESSDAGRGGGGRVRLFSRWFGRRSEEARQAVDGRGGREGGDGNFGLQGERSRQHLRPSEAERRVESEEDEKTSKKVILEEKEASKMLAIVRPVLKEGRKQTLASKRNHPPGLSLEMSANEEQRRCHCCRVNPHQRQEDKERPTLFLRRFFRRRIR